MKKRQFAAILLTLVLLFSGTANAAPPSIDCPNCGFPAANQNNARPFDEQYHKCLFLCFFCSKEFFIDEVHTPIVDPAVAPTCTLSGLTAGSHCSVCKAVMVAQEVVPATGHTPAVDPAVVPTCIQPGWTEGSHCSVCNAVLVEQEVVPPTGHTPVIDPAVAATCTQTGLTAGSHCSICGAVLEKRQIVPALCHQYALVERVSPTCDQAGYTLIRCERCGDERTNIQERLHHWYGPWSPAGDNTHTAECDRCGHTCSAPCQPDTFTLGGQTLSVCPVCGALNGGEGSLSIQRLVMAILHGASARRTPGNVLPSSGELIARFVDNPLGADSSVLRLYTLAFELAGQTVPTDPLGISLPLDGEQPAFRLFCVSGPDANLEIPFEIKEGSLLFNATLPGAFALLED